MLTSGMDCRSLESLLVQLLHLVSCVSCCLIAFWSAKAIERFVWKACLKGFKFSLFESFSVIFFFTIDFEFLTTEENWELFNWMLLRACWSFEVSPEDTIYVWSQAFFEKEMGDFYSISLLPKAD